MSDSFIFDISIVKSLKNVDDATYRKMMDAVMQYCVDGTEPELDGLEEGLFTSWMALLDNLNASRRNGKKGGRPAKEDNNDIEIAKNDDENGLKPPFNPLLTPLKGSENPFSQEKEEREKERTKEKEKEEKEYLNIYGENPDALPKPDSKTEREKETERQAEELFNELWKLYPKKKGKGSVSMTQKKRLLKVGREQMIRCVDRFIADHKNTDEQYLPYGSTFFNSGYIDYLDSETEQLEEPPKIEHKLSDPDYLDWFRYDMETGEWVLIDDG